MKYDLYVIKSAKYMYVIIKNFWNYINFGLPMSQRVEDVMSSNLTPGYL